MTTDTIPDHYPETWDKSWVPALQTADKQLDGTFMPDNIEGDRKWYNIGGTIAFKKKTARYAKTTRVNYVTGKSWIYTEAWDAPVLEDEWDEAFLASIVLPTSRIMQDQASAYNRLVDSYVRDAADGGRVTGANGTTTEVFPTANVVAANFGGSDVGITWKKIVEVQRKMNADRVSTKDRYFAIGSTQLAELMEVAEAVNRDYVNTALIVSGEIHGTKWAGFEWRLYEDLEADATDTDARKCLAWSKRDIIVGDSGMKTHMDVLPGESHALQIRPVTKLGSGRLNNSSYRCLCQDDNI
jgi:hypothetical protein